ncbi:SAP30-binding protein isoform X2 [Octopus bimaculoides]|uniref:SAP30-binding protein n=1 Tax=Octopus bimaculoides TaxID=37653 RepID=A0A0L8FL04_OCTBM|nr:SAP30-binding protein isoform X2 [Octopus bimaculoides]|eukprot:XP_014788939.1 PREDICTED: SAP30-binding protein-like isoform X2 [Octopus bimaculoides]
MTETAGMLSIGTYGENSDEENDEAVSDDGDTPNHHHHNNTNNNNTITPPSKDLTEAVAVDNISDDEIRHDSENNNNNNPINSVKPPLLDFKDNRSDDGSKDYKVKKAKTRLVSYGNDFEDKSESEKEDSDVDPDPEKFLVVSQDKDSVLKPEQASSLSRSVQNMAADEIQLPPEPPGRCSRALQEKIAHHYNKMKQEGCNLSLSIQKRKGFRNPSIYEKLIEFCQINEKGTNYPPEIFDPLVWGSDSLYDSLDKMQKLDMEKREKERKERTKIEFVTGTKKLSTEGPVEKKRKTKWDAQPQGVTTAPAALVRQPVVTSAMLNAARGALTTAVTGTKSTVIPALGNILKSK